MTIARIDRAEGHSFLELDESAVVLDLGCNRGRFSSYVAERYKARVVALEPDPRLTPRIPPSVDLRRVALGNGLHQALAVSSNGDSSLVFHGERLSTVPTVTLGQLLRELGTVDLVKVDVEGTEVEALLNTEPVDLRRADQFTVEFHDFVDRTLEPGVAAARRHVREAGFVELRFSGDQSDVLFVNHEHRHLSRSQRAGLLFRHRYVAGARRILQRRLKC
jgi:FkbM family methyltransferase